MPSLQPVSSNHLRLVSSCPPFVIGRYELTAQLARGGIATVYLGRLRGGAGLHRLVAIKRLHAQFRTDNDISAMFLDEARVAMRVRHTNVIHAIDVVLHEDELFIVMEYIEGASLSQLLRDTGKRNQAVPVAIAASIVAHALHGLHAAHEAKDEHGQPLGIVHRDVSPQNLLVGTDGIARVLDFGIAKTVSQAHVTRPGEIKGKLTYMAPEQLNSGVVTRATDLFSAGIVLWELLTGHRLFYGDNDGEVVCRVLDAHIPAPSTLNPAVSSDLDDLVLRALERDPSARFQTAEEMAIALERLVPSPAARDVGAWVRSVASDALDQRARLVAQVERAPTFEPDPTSVPSVSPGPRLERSSSGRSAGLAAAVAGVLALGSAGLLASSFFMRPAASKDVPAATSGTPPSAPVPPSGAAIPVLSPPAIASSAPPNSNALPSVQAAKRPRPPPPPARTSATVSVPLYTRD